MAKTLDKTKRKPKPRIVRWRGVLASKSRTVRRMIALVLVVASVTFTFTQLGFVEVILPGGDSTYVVVVLQIVALAALLLGTIPGMAIGLLAGVSLYAHALMLPLDHYELSFVTPVSSIVMLAVSGFLLGILFAFVLRNNPSQVKRVIYIIIVCFIVSWLYSIGFILNAIGTLIVSLVETGRVNISDEQATQMAAAMVFRLGNVTAQARITAILMAFLCIVGDFIAQKMNSHEGTFGLRVVFGAWLSVVVVLSFMAMAAVSFAVTTGDALRDTEGDMRREIAYVRKQLEASEQRAYLLQEIHKQGEFDYEKVEMALLADLADILENRVVLDGFTMEENGLVLITIDDTVYASDIDAYTKEKRLSDVLMDDAIASIELSAKTGTMQRFVLDSFGNTDLATMSESDAPEELGSLPCIAYVYAEDFVRESDYANDASADFKQRIIIIETSDQVFAKRKSVMVWMTLSQLVLMLAVFAMVFFLLHRVVVRRIDETNSTLARITAGDLEARAEVCDTHELESLSRGINTTVEALRGWIAEAETRMDAELETAKAIQESALPRVFPPYPDILRFDIYATMNAAKQVGGDFYDFFLIGDANSEQGKLGFVMADVSGKGVPAALFMMKAKTQIRDYLENGVELGEAIENVNRQLCDSNDADMFVTAWIGVLDYATGHVEYVNAGHNPPLLWQHEGGWRWIKERSGLPLGLFDGLPYKKHSIDCRVGEQLLLYTDGVTEAMDVDGVLYGEERLERLANENYYQHPRMLVDAIRRDVATHALGAEQSDDITIMALEIGVPPEVTATLIVPANVDVLPHVNEFIHTELDRRLCPLRTQNQLDIAVEELFVNVCHYAYPNSTPENPGMVRVSYTYSADPPSVCVGIADDGIPYNPLEKPDAQTPDDIMEVPIGGLGILMAKRSVDQMTYEREGSSNVVNIIKKW